MILNACSTAHAAAAEATQGWICQAKQRLYMRKNAVQRLPNYALPAHRPTDAFIRTGVQQRFLAAFSAALALAGCGSVANINTQGSFVRVVYEKPSGCKALGEFYGRGATEEYAMNNLKNIIGESGGNYLMPTHRDEIRTTFVIGHAYSAYGLGFHCSNK